MGIPVFDIKTEASALLFKQADGAGKTAPGDFTKIFNGCVVDCVEPKDSSIKAATAPAKADDISLLAGQGVFAADAEKVGVAIDSTSAVKVEAGNESATASPSVTEVVTDTLPVEPLTISSEPPVINIDMVKTAQGAQMPADNPVISEKGVHVQSLETVILQPVTERASYPAPTQELSEISANTALIPAVAPGISTQVETIEAGSVESTAAKKEKISAADSKAPRTQKPSRDQEASILKKDDAKSPASLIHLIVSTDKAAEKTVTVEVKGGDTAKASKKEVMGEKADSTSGDEKPEGVVTAPAISNGASGPDISAALSEVADPAPSAPTIQMSAEFNRGNDKTGERPVAASGEKALEATKTANAEVATLPIALSDSFSLPDKVMTSAPVMAADIKSTQPVTVTDPKQHDTIKQSQEGYSPVVMTAAPVKTADIKPTKAVKGPEPNRPDTAKTPQEVDAPLEMKPAVKTEYASAVKKADSPADGLPSANTAQSAASATTVPADGKGAAVKAPTVQAPLTSAERLHADNTTPASNEAVAPDRHTTTLPVGAASWSEGFDAGEERTGDGKENRKEGLSKVDSAGFLHGGAEARSSRPTQAVNIQRQGEAARPEAVFEKLDTGVKMSLGKGGREVSLSLSPEHLGQLNIRLNIEETAVKARIVVESDAAKAILETDSNKLKEVFARQGLTLDKYTIELGAGNSPAGGGLTDSGARENTFGRPSSWSSTAARDEEAAGTKNYVQQENTRRSTGGVDLFA